jgi:hypothetical protein
MVEKIILELRDKDFVKNGPHLISTRGEDQEHKLERNLEQDIVSTLTNM